MRLKASTKAAQLHVSDIYGFSVALGTGLRMARVAYFCDVVCSPGNFFVYPLAGRHDDPAQPAFDVIIVFDQVEAFTTGGVRQQIAALGVSGS